MGSSRHEPNFILTESPIQGKPAHKSACPSLVKEERILYPQEFGFVRKEDVVNPPALSRNQVRQVDHLAVERFHMPSVLLMENAGRGAVEVLEAQTLNGPTVICAGKGNNGGDGFVMARHLENHGFPVKVLLFSDPNSLAGDAKINFEILTSAQTPVEILGTDFNHSELRYHLTSADWIVDALLGTGTQGEIREPFRGIISAINEAARPVFSVDLPSGMDCDTGKELGVCIKASITATFVARKIGFDQPGASNLTGKVHVVEIGVPYSVFNFLQGE